MHAALAWLSSPLRNELPVARTELALAKYGRSYFYTSVAHNNFSFSLL